jgi:hypothetical protein
MIVIIVLLIVILTLWYFECLSTPEGFRSCGGCDQEAHPSKNAVLNPFVFPYSGESNPDVNNRLFASEKPYVNSTPDHEPETN